jgi:cyclophilin family peptidyl-prolyl cis-trans isomerase
MTFARFLALILIATLSRLGAQIPQLTATLALPAPAFVPAGGAAAIDLRNHFGFPGVTGPIVQFDTSLGRFNVEIRSDAAPRHAANFLAYVQAGTYPGTFIHRSAALEAGGNSIVQGGGFRVSEAGSVAAVPKLAPVALEYALPNARGTLAAARTNDVNSATSEWYFNVRDNSTILGPANGGGYSVFGRVLGGGMTVVDRIGALPVYNAEAVLPGLVSLPLRDYTGGSLAIGNLVLLNAVTRATVYPGGSEPGVISFTVSSSNPAAVTANLAGATLNLAASGTGTSEISVTASEAGGGSVTRTFTATVGGGAARQAPVLTTEPPAEMRLAAGPPQPLVLAVSATANPAPSYQWRRNRVDLPGQRGPLLVLPAAGAGDAGAYTCVVANAEGSVESRPCAVSFSAATPAQTGRLTNLSIRSPFARNETLTIGTVVGGANTSGPKPLLARVGGPALAQFDLPDVMPDPRLAWQTSTGAVVAGNDNWGGSPSLAAAFQQVGAFPYRSPDSRDAAILEPALPPGAYLLEVRDATGAPGTALAELYDATPTTAVTGTSTRLVNVSVRRDIPEGESLVAGFFLGGETARTVLIRGVGPGLAQFNVPETMPDPVLTLFGAGGIILGENDNWGGAPELAAFATAAGAFALTDPRANDALLLLTLPPGIYTVQLTGRQAGGVALMEVYEIR